MSEYSARVTRANPCLIVLLVDTSSSMGDALDHGTKRIDFVADAINRALAELVVICQRHSGVYDYFEIALLTYDSKTARPAFGGALAGREIVKISELRDHPLRTESRMRRISDGAGGLVEVPVEFDIWFEPNVGGGTATCSALRTTAALVQTWCAQNPRSFPPVVMHLTDGEAGDAGATPEAMSRELQAAARHVTGQRTEDGYALLLNLHIFGGGAPVSFPSTAGELPANAFARALFECSSTLPPPLLKRGFQQGLRLQPGSRGYIFNGRIEEIVTFFDIGTKAAADLIVPGER